MNRKVTVVLYHYVRNLKNSQFPSIKGLDINDFNNQIKFLKKNYNLIKMEDLIYSIDNNISLPTKSVLLTFDDGYTDHFNNVLPILLENNIQGSFYPPVKAVVDNQLLDVNKIHHILASISNSDLLIKDIFILNDKYRKDYNLKFNDDYYKYYAIADRYDSEKTIFIKRFLQKGISEELRNIYTSFLFNKYINIPEIEFAKNLYMNIDQIKTMNNLGMHIGSHSYDHLWLGTLNTKEQEFQIDKSIQFLNKIGVATNNWTMTYPYGSYNEDTIKILSNKGCKLAFSTKVEITNLDIQNKYELPRIDTNDLPKVELEKTNNWYNLA